MQRRLVIKLTVGGLLVAGLVAWALAHGVDWSRWTPATLRVRVLQWGPWAPLTYVVGYTARVAFLIPASLYTLTGVILFGPWWGALYIVLGNTLCSVIEFGLARWMGREAIERFLARTHTLLRFDRHVAAHGFTTVLLIRLIPNVPLDLQNLSLGLSPVRLRDFLLGTVLGILPWCVAYAFLGEAVTDFRSFWKVLLGILALVLVIWTPWLWRQWRAQSS